jgi:hypothetical protein
MILCNGYCKGGMAPSGTAALTASRARDFSAVSVNIARKT